MLNFAHLEEILNLLLHQLLGHIDQNLELRLSAGVVHLDYEAFETAEMLVVKEFSNKHLAIIHVDEGSSNNSFGA
jgi:hypothetical protein